MCYQVGSDIKQMDTVGTETNICIEIHPMSGTMCVLLVVFQATMSNIAK